MLTLIILLTYFVVGLTVARITFVRILGDSPRHKPHTYSKLWTDAFIGAFWGALAALVAWPLFAPIAFILRATPNEKLKTQEKQLKVKQAQLREQQYELNKTLRTMSLPELEF